MYFITRKEAKENRLSVYFTGKPCKHGHISVRHTSNYDCLECRGLQWQRWYSLNQQKYRDTKKKYYIQNRDWYNEFSRNYHYTNHEYSLKRAQRWKENNREKYIAKNRYYASLQRVRKKNATLLGQHQSEMKAIYRNCPEGYEVDHITPLNGKEVCGLHVPWNLQYLPARENRKKSNKVLH